MSLLEYLQYLSQELRTGAFNLDNAPGEGVRWDSQRFLDAVRMWGLHYA